jgi:hypothetical protein
MWTELAEVYETETPHDFCSWAILGEVKTCPYWGTEGGLKVLPLTRGEAPRVRGLAPHFPRPFFHGTQVTTSHF